MYVSRFKKRFFLIASLLLLGWLGWVAFKVHSWSQVDGARQADCIIVLGAAVTEGRPSPVFTERIHHAIGLYKRQLAHAIIFTGGVGQGDFISESEAAKLYAIEMGIPAERIFLDLVSVTTRENLVRAKDIMDGQRWHSAIVVSDPYHQKRACTMAEDLAMNVHSSPTPTSMFRSVSARATFLLREVYFLHHYWITGR